MGENTEATVAEEPTPEGSNGKKGLQPIVAIFLTVLIDLLGFAMFIPDLQLRGQDLARQFLNVSKNTEQVEILVGVALSSFSVAQLLTGPWLGRLSDQKGRRTVLLISSALGVVSYVLYAHATSLPIMYLSRMLAGVAAANLGVAFAYVADISKPEDRAKSLGLLGAAFGLGFIFGPPLGAKILEWGNDNPLVLGYTSAILVAINFFFILKFVPESLKRENVSPPRKFLADLQVAFRTPGLSLLLAMFFFINLGFTNLETTYFRLWETDTWIFAYGERAKQVGAEVLFAVGIIGAIMQGGVIRVVTPKFGELKLLKFGYLLFVPALALVPFTKIWFPGILVIIGLGIANGLAGPSLSSLISRSAPRTMQGGVFGITQSLGAFARATSPLMSSPLFSYKPWAPYVFGAVLAVFPLIAAWFFVKPAAASSDGDTSSSFVE